MGWVGWVGRVVGWVVLCCVSNNSRRQGVACALRCSLETPTSLLLIPSPSVVRSHALLLALLHWVRFSLGWYLQPPFTS
mgnify:CR=1 FL=1